MTSAEMDSALLSIIAASPGISTLAVRAALLPYRYSMGRLGHLWLAGHIRGELFYPGGGTRWRIGRNEI